MTRVFKGFQVLEDKAGLLEASLALGRVERDLGNFVEATSYLDQALDLAQANSDLQAEVSTLNLQASLLDAQGEVSRALSCLEQALNRSRAFPELQADILNNIGTLAISLGNFPKALESLTQAYTLLQDKSPGTRSAASNLVSLGYLYQELGNPVEAERFFSKAKEVGHSLPDPKG